MGPPQIPSYAKKSLGQNFLVDDNYIRKIIDAVDPADGDTIVEIGPGRGAITEKLIASGANVIAIELDRELVPVLREQFPNAAYFTVVEADAIEFDFASLNAANPNSAIHSPQSKVVANLPYYISTAILQKMSEQRELFSSLVLMFQREVVDRITAEPGNSDRGFLTVLVESAFAVEKLFDVPPTAFRPQPKVWSSVVRLTPKENVISHPEPFRRLLSAAFAQKRKTILNNLKTFSREALTALKIAEIDPGRRAETLTLDEWLRLADAITQD
jgi:16S rRNA (adenine1518-N6/adenine1519-N6)-dimethyltransferase